jgi:serine/threonine-protein kinase
MAHLVCRACAHEYDNEKADTPCPRCGERPGSDTFPTPANEAGEPALQQKTERRASTRSSTKSDKDPSTGSVIAGYKLEQRVGDGATSAVYKAIDPASAEQVAVKVLSVRQSQDSEAIERFSREARLARRIKHPNLVHVRDSGVDHLSGAHYLVMDFVAGETLEALIRREGPLPWRQALEYVFQVAQAVDLLRRHGCVHRDIKPANILIADGVAKLTDLGFVKPVSEAPNDHDALIMGTPAYMAPEQAIDAREATHAADVYALGATLYHALTGSAPFSGSDGDEIMQRVLKERPPPPLELAPELPESVDMLVRWAMSKDPQQRPIDAAAFGRSIAGILGNPENTDTILRARRRWPLGLLPFIAVAIAAAAIGVVATLLLSRR